MPDGPGDGFHGPPRGALQNVRYFLAYLRPVWFLTATVIATNLLATVAQLPLMFVPKVLTDSLRPQEFPWGLSRPVWLLTYLTVALAIGFGSHGLSLLGAYCSNRIGGYVLRAIRTDLFGRLEQLSMLSVASRGAGQFVQRLARDVYVIRGLINETLTEMAFGAINGTVFFVVLMWLEWKLTLILLAAFALVTPIVRWLNRRLERLARQEMTLSEEILAQLIEAISGFRDILASGRFDRFARRFGDSSREAERVGLRTAMTAQYSGLLGGAVRGALMVVPYFVIVHDLTPETLGTAIIYIGFLGSVLPLPAMFMQLSSQLAMANPALQEVRNVLEEPPEQLVGARPAGTSQAIAAARAAPSTPAVQLPIRSIRFDHVTLVLGGRPLVEDVTFEIPGGKFTAVLGQSGAGKTTIFHLLLRLLRPTEGAIYLNDVPLAEIDDAEIRRLLGFIPQNPFIFNLSLRENLLMACGRQPSEDELRRAVEMAQLAQMIEHRRNEGGLEAVAGFMGARLSGGEKQRIALGRLLLQDPAVVICDEYTANIDVRTARLIHEALRRQFADRTRIVITHELYTVRGADHLIILDRGRVVQTGTHQQLVQQPGLYRAMWEVQRVE